MMSLEEIHRSVIEVDDLEEIHDGEISISDVFRSIVSHPFQIIARWNWKVALIGSSVRAFIYLVTYKATNSWVVTLAAVFVELGFRFLTSGFFGALTQSFRRANPAWLASLTVTLMFPLISHIIEYFTHFAQEKWFSDFLPASGNEDSRLRSFAISVLFSVLSALFNMYMMRHGVLLVGAGEETKSFKDDLKSIPQLVVDFTIYLPNQIVRFATEGKILWAIGLFLSFGLTVGGILGTCRGRWTWAINTSLGAWGLLLFAVIGSTIFAIVAHYKNRQTKE
jgi:hypothetical protein